MFSADLGVNQVASYPPATDPPFQKVALLLHGDGTNGAQNNTFVDYSYPGGYAVSFDGTGDYLTVPDNSAFTLGSGNFTVEAWVYWNGTNSGTSWIIGQTNTAFSLSNTSFLINKNSTTNVLRGGVCVGSSFYSTQGTDAIPSNTWFHIAFVRDSGTLRLYLNGVQIGTNNTISTLTVNDSSGLLGIGNAGDYSATSESWNGYISNLRVVKGTALYTNNFTPSNQPLTAVSGTQLLTCQSATIVDNSPNAFTITANGNAAAVSSKTITRTGNVAQGTFSPFSVAEGQWSNYFDGTGDWLSAASSTSLDVSSGNFTVECWLYSNTLSSDKFVVYRGATAITNGADLQWGIYTSGTTLYVRPYQSTTDYSISLGTISTGTWYHIALVRNGDTFTGYLNGVAGATTKTVTGSLNNNAAWNGVNIGLGTIVGTAYATVGYISNLRVVKGTALYTSNFTPSTTPLTAVSGTSLLTCQSNRFKDNSSNNFTITRNGDTKVTAFSPFAPSAAYSASTNGGSGYFDGSGDYLSVTNNAAFNLSSNNFTIEAWVYHTSESGTQNYYRSQIANVSSNAQGFRYVGNGQIQFFGFNGSSSVVGVSSATGVIRANEWNHVAVVRNGNNTQIYVNGVASGTPQTTGYTIGNSPTNPWIGGYQNGTELMAGYITNFRFVNGTAVYTSNFTPPTAPLTAVANTQLLLNCTNAGIIDNAGKNDIETVGNAQISTSVKKYGTGSMYFDGTGDYLKVPTDALFGFGAGDFTIEAWVYPLTTGTDRAITDFRVSAVANGTFFINTTEKLTWWNGSVSIGGTGTSLTTNAWNHVALSRVSGTTRAFLNGVQQWSSTGIGTQPLTAPLGVGAAPYDGTSPFNGYIDDLRITKGQALYTSNFTPPTQAFPDV